MLFKLLAEFIGTFLFLSVILNSASAGHMGALSIGLGLAVAILFGGKISGGHFNPAVSVMMLAKKSMSLPDFAGYIVSQVLGGLCALGFSQAAAGGKLKLF